MNISISFCAIGFAIVMCSVAPAFAKPVAHGVGSVERESHLLNSVTDTVLGRWCDTMVPGNRKYRREIKIVVTNSGAIARTKLFDGSRRSMNLSELSGGVFTVIGSSSGDAFRISGGSGELQLLDRDGYIRSARRLENNSAGGDCVR